MAFLILFWRILGYVVEESIHDGTVMATNVFRNIDWIPPGGWITFHPTADATRICERTSAVNR